MTLFFLCIIFRIVHIASNASTVKNKYAMLITMAIIIELFNIKGGISIEGITIISYKFIAEIVVYLYSIYGLITKKLIIEKNIFFFYISVIVLFTVGIFYEIVVPYDGDIISPIDKESWDGYVLGLTSKVPVNVFTSSTMILFFKAIFSLLNVAIIKSTLNKDDLISILLAIIKFGKVCIIYGIFEFGMKVTGNINLYKTVDDIVWGGKAYLGDRGGYFALSGIESEPSHFVMALFYLLVIILITNKIDKIKNTDYKFMFLSSIALIVLSGGFSAYWIFLMLICIYIALKFNFYEMRIAKLMLCGFVLVFLCMTIPMFIDCLAQDTTSYIGYRMNSVNIILAALSSNTTVTQNMIFDSSAARFISIYDTLIDFTNRPLFGLGIGVETSHGGVSNLFADVGVSGVIAILIYIMKSSSTLFRKYDFCLIFICIFIFNLPLGLRSLPYEMFIFFIFESTSLYCIKERVVKVEIKRDNTRI